ncbi:MAG: hypothetical protein LBP75_00915 [Planctomycetota bacterium]|jgi:hypothetical protein|nr:hypothetical protein [Planctomycetota bacterium]
MRNSKFRSLAVVFLALSAVTLFTAATYNDYTTPSFGTITATYNAGSLSAQSPLSNTTITSSTPALATITNLVLTSSKNLNSAGSAVIYVRLVKNGVTTEASKPWAQSLTFSEFNGKTLSGGVISVWIIATRPTAGAIAAFSLTSVKAKINYTYD